jgi:DNA-binding NtrC family response regulator
MSLPHPPSELPRTVLVVEDEARLRDMLVRAIPDMGFEVAGLGSAEQALRRLETLTPSIAIIDLNLPGMSGLELFEQLRQRWPRVQVVILTGYGSLDAARQSIRLGVADFLTKPCTLGELEQALDRAWQRRVQAEREPAGKPRLMAIADEPPAPPPPDPAEPRSLREIERLHILAALERHQGNRNKAARELGISPRTLYYRLAEYGVAQRDEVEP